jgi:hypothetical protein
VPFFEKKKKDGPSPMKRATFVGHDFSRKKKQTSHQISHEGISASYLSNDAKDAGFSGIDCRPGWHYSQSLLELCVDFTDAYNIFILQF